MIRRYIVHISVIAIIAISAVLGVSTLYDADATGTGGVIAVAESYIGTPYYLEGLALGYGLDCADFVSTVYSLLGYSLPSDPTALMEYGTWTDYPIPGDIVFFSEDYSGYVTHVGLYHSDGMIIHSSTYFGEVVVSEMVYIEGYMGAKRIIV